MPTWETFSFMDSSLFHMPILRQMVPNISGEFLENLLHGYWEIQRRCITPAFSSFKDKLVITQPMPSFPFHFKIMSIIQFSRIDN